MTVDDVSMLLGWFLGAFSIGYGSGYLVLTFKKVLDTST